MNDSQSNNSDRSPCPKCGRKREPQLAACPRCGLRFSLWRAEQADPRNRLDARAQELWQRAQASWKDAGRHEEFTKYCLQANILPAAGRCYRDRLDAVPGDAIATRMQAEILSKATLGLVVQQQRRPSEPITRSKWFWVIVVTSMALAILGAFIWGPGAMRAPAPTPPNVVLPAGH
jgi:hypothetical protein